MVPFCKSSTATVAAGFCSAENMSWLDSGLMSVEATFQVFCEFPFVALNFIAKVVELVGQVRINGHVVPSAYEF